ncbi:DUF1080 domain-containing protein [bacterium]|nr:DUF1080 domain-containing protein [bacterium]
MKLLLPCLFLTAVLSTNLVCVQAQTDTETVVTAPAETDDFKSIFNGVDLTGWTGDSRLWKVENGVIRGETTEENPAKGNTFLIWEAGSTADFELRLSFRVSSENNSGIQYRSEHITDPSDKPKNDFVMKGYQHEIRNSGDLPNVAGFIYDEKGKRRRMCLVGEKAIYKDGQKVVEDEIITGEEFKSLFKVDKFNDVVIVAKGNHIQHFLNDRLILDFTDTDDKALLSGSLGLQLHQGKPMWCEFKDIRIKKLNDEQK